MYSDQNKQSAKVKMQTEAKNEKANELKTRPETSSTEKARRFAATRATHWRDKSTQ